MFTGIVSGVGRIVEARALGVGAQFGKLLAIEAPAGFLDAVHLGETSKDKRERAESLLARYHALSAAEHRELLRWYRQEASAMDAALIASNARIQDRYRAFRRDHIDAFSWKEKLIGALLAGGALAFLGAVAVLGYQS